MTDRRMTVHIDTTNAYLTFRDSRYISSCPPGPRTVPVGGLLLEYPPTVSSPDPTVNPTNITFQGGAIAPGVPVQLVFWGDWWNAGGQSLKSSLETAVQSIIAGPYTWALDQYGISQPSYRGSYVAGGTVNQFSWSNVQKLIQGLIDTNVFPEPDETGGRNGYFVMLPQGSTDTTNPRPCGAHGQQVDTGFLGLDPDHAWVAYVNYNNNNPLDAMTSCFSHELAELLTDPEQDAWYVKRVPGNSSEVGDLCDVQQNWVHGVKVRAYWSKRDQKCVIPTDAFYSVCISGTIDEVDVSEVASGKAHPKSPDGMVNKLIPACDFSKMEFGYTTYKRVETASLKATATDYHAPVFSWFVAGQPLAAGSGTVSFKTDVTYPSPGGYTRTSNDTVSLAYSASGDALTLKNDGVLGNFDVPISVSVDEDPTQSNQALNGARTSGLVASYVGLTIDEPDYQGAVDRCAEAAFEFWKMTHPHPKTQPGPVNPGPLHEYDLELLGSLPGWVTPEQREKLKDVIIDTALLRTEAPEAADQLRETLLGALGLGNEIAEAPD